MRRKNNSLFSRARLIIGITLFLFQAVIIIAIIIFLIMPVIKSSAVTMAAIMNMSAQTWLKLAPDEHEAFNKELKRRYNFELYVDNEADIDSNARPHEPYLFYLEDELGKQLKHPPRFYGDRKNHDMYWIKYNYQGHLFEIAVPLHQPGGQPHAAIIAIIVFGLIMLYISSWFLAYCVNTPINRLINSVKQMTYGFSPKPIPETGCEELGVLAHSVNTMASKLKDLLENRTVMLAGISHDLRTPLTRMALSVEMLPEDNNKQLTKRIRQDIHLMNEMIGHYMELACCLTKEKPEQLDLHDLIQSYIYKIQQHSKVDIELIMPVVSSDSIQKLWVYPVALKRIINNLLENAIRYGEAKPVIVSCEKVTRNNAKYIIIKITDHGPGISAEEIEKVFHPFYRVDKSRNSKSGGSGLGLAIVYHLTQAHDWLIELESPPNEGLTANLTLPIR
ncbi:MAG: HAMP domain-containing protein [Gammaproteobacteria bacterium]|nr:HAMP domain-containing protein [Gammaproteobacteria bacterium]